MPSLSSHPLRGRLSPLLYGMGDIWGIRLLAPVLPSPSKLSATAKKSKKFSEESTLNLEGEKGSLKYDGETPPSLRNIFFPSWKREDVGGMRIGLLD